MTVTPDAIAKHASTLAAQRGGAVDAWIDGAVWIRCTEHQRPVACFERLILAKAVRA
jgi:hypothetical protein